MPVTVGKMNSPQFTKEEMVSLCKVFHKIEGNPPESKHPLFKFFESVKFDIPLFRTVLTQRSMLDYLFFGNKVDEHYYARFQDAISIPFRDIPIHMNRHQGLYKNVLLYRLEVLGK